MKKFIIKKTAVILFLILTIHLPSSIATVDDSTVLKGGDILHFGKSSSEVIDPSSIEVLIWNQYKGRMPSWQIDFNFLKANKDLLILEESMMTGMMASTYENDLKFEHVFANSFGDTGLSTAATVTPIQESALLTKSKEVLVTTRKVTLFTYYPLKNCNRPLLVVNIHGINAVTHATNKQQLIDIFEKIKGFDGPAIFAGDFNSWSPVRTEFLLNIMKNYFFSPVKFEPDERMRVFDNVVDHIFLRGFTAVNSKAWGNIFGSDHKALTATIEMSDPSWCHND